MNATYGALQASGLYDLNQPAAAEIPLDNTYDEVPTIDDGIHGQFGQFTTILVGASNGGSALSSLKVQPRS